MVSDGSAETISDSGVTTSETFKKENSHGVEKDHVRVDIGTQQVEVPRWLHNPLTDRRHDLTKLSDDGYLKPFLAFTYARKGPDVVDLSQSPVLTFDTDRWELVDGADGQIVLRKKGAETPLDEMVLDVDEDAYYQWVADHYVDRGENDAGK